MKIFIYILILAGIIGLGAWSALVAYNQEHQPVENGKDVADGVPRELLNTYATSARDKKDLILVTNPVAGATIHSPLTVSGEARGTWFFEASFPLILTDWDGRILAQGYASAEGDWMTEEFVSFTGTLEFTALGNDIYSHRGTLIFKKDNPSGLPEHDDALEMPVMIE